MFPTCLSCSDVTKSFLHSIWSILREAINKHFPALLRFEKCFYWERQANPKSNDKWIFLPRYFWMIPRKRRISARTDWVFLRSLRHMWHTLSVAINDWSIEQEKHIHFQSFVPLSVFCNVPLFVPLSVSCSFFHCSEHHQKHFYFHLSYNRSKIGLGGVTRVTRPNVPKIQALPKLGWPPLPPPPPTKPDILSDLAHRIA